MARVAFVMLLLGSICAWGETPTGSAAPVTPAPKVDKAAAYYHFVLTHMYSELASVAFGAGEYERLASENYKAALRADPATPDPRALVSPFAQIYVPRPRQERARPAN